MSRSSARHVNFVSTLHAVAPDTVVPTGARQTRDSARLTPMSFWFAALLVLLFALGSAPVRRTQEARVMETAREMLERQPAEGLRALLIPHCNGSIRLQKPPLAYWLSAASFATLGVNEWAGRLSMMLAGWSTLGLTMWLAADWFGRRASMWTGAVLLGSFLFFRHSRLAETDVLVTLFITAAIFAILRGFDRRARSILWFQLSGLMIGLAIMAKGAPAVFPLIFLLALCAIESRWRDLRAWLFSGAPLIAIVVGAPWWVYVRTLPNWREVMADEATDLFEGKDHFRWFWDYGPMLLRATLPWCGFGIAALVEAAVRRRYSRQARLLVWCGAILVPLCIIGQKQDHYLFPLMPPLAILTGEWIARQREESSIARPIFVITFVITVIATVSLPVVTRRMRAEVMTSDMVILGALLVALTIIGVVWQRSDWRAALVRYAMMIVLLLGPLLSIWWPSVARPSQSDIATRIRERAGAGPYCFYGDNFSLPLVFAMRTVIPIARDAAALQAMAGENAHLVVIAQTKSDREPPSVPEGFEQVDEIRSDDQRFEVYRKR